MTEIRYNELLTFDNSERFVRSSLVALESDFRRLALSVLSAWSETGVVSDIMFRAAELLPRPSWGSWNGLIDTIRNARKNTLRSGAAEDRKRLEDSEELSQILNALDQKLAVEVNTRIKPLAKLLRNNTKRFRLAQALAMPITLRNQIAHDAPTDPSWWQEAVEALKPLIQYHATDSPVSSMLQQQPASPWCIEVNGNHAYYNGLTHDFAVKYAVVDDGNTKLETLEQHKGEVLRALQTMLGRDEVQEDDFKKLLGKLAPEDIKGVMLNDFLVGAPAGQGGFATVHKGVQLSTGRRVAIKILNDGQDEDTRARFRQEAAMLSRFNHANIIGVLGYGEDTWRAPRSFSLEGENWYQSFSKSAPVKSWIALEWVEGENLEDVYQRAIKDPNQKPDQRTLTAWFKQSAHALATVHANDLIHRDIKPSNLMVTGEPGDTDRQIKLMDFGIARSDNELRTIHTMTGHAFGTEPYMSPEQLRAKDADAGVGPATDVYSLCATFYELSASRRLYNHDTESSETVKTNKREGKAPQHPKLSAADLPWELGALLMGGLESEPTDRPESMEALEADLQRYLNDQPITYKRPSVLRRTSLAYKRNRTVANLVATFTIVGLLGIGFYVYSINEEQQKTLEAKLLAEENANSERLAKELADDNAREAKRQAGIAKGKTREAEASESKAINAEAETKRQLDQANHNLALTFREKAAAAAKKKNARERLLYLANARELSRETVSETEIGIRLAECRELWRSPTPHLSFTSGSIALDPTAKIIAGAAAKNSVQLLELRTGALVRTLAGHTNWVSSVAYSCDGKTICSGSYDNSVRLWSVETGQELHKLEGHRNNVECVAFSPDGEMVASGGGEWDGFDFALRIWNVATGRELQKFEGHARTIECLAFSPDGRMLVSGGWDDTLRLWDLESGKELGIFVGHSSVVCDVAFSPDGNTVVSGSYDGTVRIWDVGSFNEVRSLTGHAGRVSSLAYASDGQTIVSAGWDRTLRFWDVKTGSELRKLEGHTNSIDSVIYSPGGQMVISCSTIENMIRLWDVDAGSELRKTNGHTDTVTSIDYSPDGKTAISGSLDGSIRLWSIAAGTELQRFVGHTKGVTTVAFSPDGRDIVSGSRDATIRIWNLESTAQTQVLTGHTDNVNSVEFSPDCRTIISGSNDSTIRFWDVKSGQQRRIIDGHERTVSSVKFGPNGRTALSGSYDGTVRLWNVETGTELRKLIGHESWVTSVAYSPDGLKAISGSGDLINRNDDSLRLWDLSSGNEIRDFVGHTNAVTSVAFGPDGRTVMSGSKDKSARLWNVQTGSVIRSYESHEHHVTSVSYSSDSMMALSGSSDNTLRLWNTDAERELREYSWTTKFHSFIEISPDGLTAIAGSDGDPSKDDAVWVWDLESGAVLRSIDGHTDNVYCGGFSPDGQTIVSGSKDKSIRLWNARTGEELRKLIGHTAEVLSVAFSPDGLTVLSSGKDRTIRLWDPDTGEEIQRYEGHGSSVYCAVFSPDGQTIMSCSNDFSLRLWDTSTGKELQKFDGHTNSVLSTKFSPDGKTVISGAWDHTVRIWNVKTGKQIRKLAGHSSPVESVAFSPDGLTALSGSLDKTIRIWDVLTGELLRTYECLGSPVESVAYCRDGLTILSGSRDGKIRLWEFPQPIEIPMGVSGLQFVEQLTGLRLKGPEVEPLAHLLPDEFKWLTDDARPPEFLRGDLPPFLKPTDDQFKERRERLRISERIEEHRQAICIKHILRFQSAEKFEGFRYEEKASEAGPIFRHAVPPRSKDERGNFIGELEGQLDWTRYWTVEIAPVAYYRKARSLGDAGKIAAALAFLSDAMAEKPDIYEFHHYKGWLLKTSSMHREAIDCFSKALSLGKPDRNTLWMRAESYFHTDQHLRAITDVNEAIKLDTQNVTEIRILRGRILAARGDYRTAISDFNAIVEADEKNLRARLFRGEAWELAGQYYNAVMDFNSVWLVHEEKGANALTEYISNHPKSSSAIVSRGFHYRATKRLDEAATDADRSIDLAPGFALGYWLRGYVYLDSGVDTDKGIAKLEKALQLTRPKDPWRGELEKNLKFAKKVYAEESEDD